MVDTVLVTGGAGFIGSHIVDALIGAGLGVVVVDDLSTGRPALLNPAARFYELDICDLGLSDVFAATRPVWVIHEAAQASVPYSMQHPAEDARRNIIGTLNLCEQALHWGARKLVFASTGGALYGQPERLPATEATPIEPLSPYGLSKHTVERYLALYARHRDLVCTVLRYGNVYGPRQDPEGESGVVAIFIDRLLRGQRPTIFGSGEQERDYVYVADVARANLLALEAGDGGVYNIATGVATSVNTLAGQVASLVGASGGADRGAARPGEVERIYLSAERAAHELGWKPTTSLAAGLQATVDWFRREGAASSGSGAVR